MIPYNGESINIEKEKWNNPFSERFLIRGRKVSFEGEYKYDPEVAKIEGTNGLINRTAYIEADEFCKVYTDSSRRKHISKLSPRASQMFLWIMYKLRAGDDLVYINRKSYMHECDVTKPTFLKATSELCDMNILKPQGKYQDLYWINPLYLYKGNRIKKYKNNVEYKED